MGEPHSATLRGLRNLLVIDDWIDSNTNASRTSTPIQLQAGLRYNLNLQYTDTVGNSQVTLKWTDSTGFINDEIIPSSQLYPAFVPPVVTTINYVYDPLYRLTEANYSDGRYFRYTYDSVGNRLTETKCVFWPCPTPITNT